MTDDELKEIREKIGSNLRAIREGKGIKLQQFADMTGVTYQQISKYEKGTNRITADRLLQFSKLLKVPIIRFYKDCI